MFHPSNININSVCLHLTYYRMRKHANCRLVSNLYVIFDVCLRKLIYITKHIYVIMLCILICYSMPFTYVFVAFTLLIFSVSLLHKLSMISVCTLSLHI